jgi:hypothetical protein
MAGEERGDGTIREPGPDRRTGLGWATVFGALAVVLAAAAIFAYVRQTTQPHVPPPPPAPPGHNKLINVLNALQAEGLDVASVPGGLPVGEMGVPGQKLTVDGQTLYVFLYPSPAEAAADFGGADPARVLDGTVGEPPFLTGHSNVVVALIGGSAEQRDKVARAVEALP